MTTSRPHNNAVRKALERLSHARLGMSQVKAALVVAAIVIAGASLVVSQILVRDLTQGERNSMAVWAEAMRSLVDADETTDLNLVLKVINGNNTIPVIVLDDAGQILAARNVAVPQDSVDLVVAAPDVPAHQPLASQLRQRAARMQQDGASMRMKLSAASGRQPEITINYEPSLMLQRLAVYPYVQLGVVALFVVVAILALLSSKRAEQNKVWVGLSRETAHQLGTPISSLMAGAEMLREAYPDEPLLPEIDKDVRRLQLIAERFSKIGSEPRLATENLCEVISRVVEYIGRRTSDKVMLTTNYPSAHVPVVCNAPLFEWVIENLCKNAIDAMAGVGAITIYVYTQADSVAVEVSDTGKGIPKNRWKTVFKPGYTTKRRGWGLGLSLAKRIVEEYHRGRIFVKASEPDRGTTFCILLKKER